QWKEESLEGLQKVCHRINLDGTDSKHIFETISERGNLADEINKIVNEKEIDLVVMGNSGRSEIDAILMGSSALDTIDRVKKCPVMTVPKDVDFEPLKEIAFVTDYQRPFAAELLRPLFFMANRYKSKIRIMHINEEEVLDKYQTKNRSTLTKFLLPFEHTFHWMPLFKSKATAINLFLEEHEVDLLVMVNNEHSFFERMTREPIIKRVVFNNTIPFLVLPHNTSN
ncbi:MAG: universal stress protein, partial [Pricia sp.]|nr:universal stress protein [Pricia sp.]